MAAGMRRPQETGAGHGGYTEPVLAAGCAVTAVELSEAALRPRDAGGKRRARWWSRTRRGSSR